MEDVPSQVHNPAVFQLPFAEFSAFIFQSDRGPLGEGWESSAVRPELRPFASPRCPLRISPPLSCAFGPEGVHDDRAGFRPRSSGARIGPDAMRAAAEKIREMGEPAPRVSLRGSEAPEAISCSFRDRHGPCGPRDDTKESNERAAAQHSGGKEATASPFTHLRRIISFPCSLFRVCGFPSFRGKSGYSPPRASSPPDGPRFCLPAFPPSGRPASRRQKRVQSCPRILPAGQSPFLPSGLPAFRHSGHTVFHQ